jgi:hypothetical protein
MQPGADEAWLGGQSPFPHDDQAVSYQTRAQTLFEAANLMGDLQRAAEPLSAI